METGPRYPSMPRPQRSNCELPRRAPPDDAHGSANRPRLLEKRDLRCASGSPAAAASTGKFGHVSGSVGREAGGPKSPRCVSPRPVPGLASPVSRSETAPSPPPEPKQRLNRPDARGTLGPKPAAEEPPSYSLARAGASEGRAGREAPGGPRSVLRWPLRLWGGVRLPRGRALKELTVWKLLFAALCGVLFHPLPLAIFTTVAFLHSG